MRRFFNRVIPERRHIQGHRNLKFLGSILHDPDIFHLTRRSAAGGVAAGLFYAFIPVPGQMILAALTAIWLRVNLPLSVILVWITNPVTIPPIFFVSYKIGSRLLDRPFRKIEFDLSWHWFGETFLEIWPSLLVGCLIMATIAAATGYFLTRLIWRMNIVRRWEARNKGKELGVRREE